MYLKSIEVQGFKSFANKIVFEFHQGITGIVGPNGSGKSNVADAVRWVLGEQSVKQLRGSSMQDVIFAGTANRRPLSYAYVAITLDNTDHKLPIEYGEVTVARRLYRSGESEYLLNGSPCRLKEVSELFYDTGIGKEGYSIIGQGQIDRILSGKPEERRELFDEAAGIVKFKKRKAVTQKKLESERENLVRVNDILSELERQVGPLEQQAQKARTYLKKKEELKAHDVNLYRMETARNAQERGVVEKNAAITGAQLEKSRQERDQIGAEYDRMGDALTQMEETVNTIREKISQTSVTREKLESQIKILTEQIHASEMTDAHLQSRLDAIARDQREKQAAKASYEAEGASCGQQLAAVQQKKEAAEQALRTIQEQMDVGNATIGEGQKELYGLLNSKADTQAKKQRLDTMVEQINIRKAELNKRLLDRKTQETDLEAELLSCQTEFDAVQEQIAERLEQEQNLSKKADEWRAKTKENNRLLEETRDAFRKQQSRLESLKNIAERYDGYGNSIRRVMEQKERHRGLLGVVSDLIQVEKKYETAIETALGGSIQNIVTEDEETAKDMIAFLKKNRYGRATFLPLTAVRAKSNPKNEQALHEPGVIGIASDLVTCEKKYKEVAAYLLGRVLVADTIDHAAAVARKNQYRLHIVTLEGESLSPGGSMTGGAFKNSSNLLARRREVEELETKVAQLQEELTQKKNRRDDLATAMELNAEEQKQAREELQAARIRQNTAKLNLDRAMQQKNQSGEVFTRLMQEREQMDQQIEEIRIQQQMTAETIAYAKQREAEIQKNAEVLQRSLQEQEGKKQEVHAQISKIQMEEAGIRQKVAFAQTNRERVEGDLKKLESEKHELLENAARSKADAGKKQQQIEEIKKTIAASGDFHGQLEQQLQESTAKKEQMAADYHGFFKKQEAITEQCSALDKEMFRLNEQLEKLKAEDEARVNYLWEEYELTPHEAQALANTAADDPQTVKKQIAAVKEEIRGLGAVNVNAIEAYKEVAERYTFLKEQHDDLVEAEKTLLGIIGDLDTGMRQQFAEKFAEIQREFNASFQHLFGGGHGALELVEEEDLLECGIRIIAQPPGKKLQNMMQMSGGEKALTAIALLFAIQALKPSPFCLLDEIEAALDDSNVSRFASYLNKLTKDTQFIVITHRRGTMTAADRLYGITMQEKGVSTLVSVDLIEHDLG